MNIYFISILLFFPFLTAYKDVPDMGWIQWEYEFSNRTICEQFIEQENDMILTYINSMFREYPHEVMAVRCMTETEAKEFNKALGHPEEWTTITPKEEKKKKTDPMM